MRTTITVAVAMVTGSIVGATAAQTLHAQGKPKAYGISELQTTGPLPADMVPRFVKLIEAAHGHSLRTVNGQVIAIEGDAPRHVAITEFDSAEDALALYKSKECVDLESQIAKTSKVLRRYIVEAEK
jgi:uncharacterized protein (DUF1330 family)